MSTLEFPEVKVQTRRAWIYLLLSLILWSAVAGLFILSEWDDLPLPWFAATGVGVLCYLLASLLKVGVLDPVRAQNVAKAAEMDRAAPPDDSASLLNAPWLPLHLAVIAAVRPGSVAPRIVVSSSAVVLTCRLGAQVLPKRDIRSVRPHAEGVELVLVSGVRLDLRTTRLPSSLLEDLFNPLAAALLAARCTALDFNLALAGRIARGEPQSPGFSSPAGTNSFPL